MSRYLFLAAIFVTLFNIALACSCLPHTFEENYCAAGTSLRGKVVAKFDSCPGTCDSIENQFRGTNFYVVRVIQQFKGPKIEDDVLYLGTPVDEGLCGIKLAIDQEYLLKLRSRETQPDTCPSMYYFIGMCDDPQFWTNLTPDQQNFVLINSMTDDSLCINSGMSSSEPIEIDPSPFDDDGRMPSEEPIDTDPIPFDVDGRMPSEEPTDIDPSLLDLE